MATSGKAETCGPVVCFNKFAQFQLVVKQKDAYLRSAQFAARALVHLLKTKQGKQKAMATMNALAGSRKCFALLNSISELQAFRTVLANDDPMTWKKILTLLKFGCMFNFWIMDNMVFVSRFAELAKFNNTWLGVNSSKLWFTAVCCDIACNSSALIDLQKQPEMSKKRHETRMKLCRNFCDFLVAAHSAKFVNLNEGLVGILGAIGGLLLCHELWP